MQKSLMVVKIMLSTTSIGGKSLCTCQHSDTKNTSLSQKSICNLLDHTQLIPTDMTNLVIFETLLSIYVKTKPEKFSLWRFFSHT